MESLPYDQQYTELRAQGLTPLAAAAAMVRANAGDAVWVLRWLSTKSPDAGTFHERWVRRSRGENRDRAWLVGYVEDGCFFYSSLSHRPDRTVFIRWQDIQSIWIQDGLNMLSLGLYCPLAPFGGKEIDAQSSMEGFAPFVREVSQRFFGAPDYLDGLFQHGGHPVRRLQVWPRKDVQQGAARNSRRAG